MKKKTLNQQLGFTPVVKEDKYSFDMNTNHVTPQPSCYYVHHEQLEAEDRPLHPLWVVMIASLVIASSAIGFCYGYAL